MNFFKSVFSDDPDPSQSESGSNNDSEIKDPDPRSATGDGDGDGWDFGGLFKTLTAKSESIIDTYRRDLQEFGTGLKKEIEVAQGSLGTVGHVIDEFGNTVVRGTAQIISQGKDAILAVDLDSDSDNGSSNRKSLDSMPYSRFDAQVRAIQGDVSTYSEEPKDLSEFNEWKSEFSLEGKSDEMESLLRENEAMESVYKRVVPNTVDDETFWYRYYYKVYRLKKAEDVRARLVNRMSNEEEKLSWDVEDDDEEEEDEYEGEAKQELVIDKEVGGEVLGKGADAQLHVGGNEVHHSGEEESKVDKRDNLLQSSGLGDKMDKSAEESHFEKSEVVGEVSGGSKETAEEVGVDKASKLHVDAAVNKNDSAVASDEKVIVETEAGDGESSSKTNGSTVVESQHLANKVEDEEEDLGWDDIEDLSSIDDKKVTQSGNTSNVDLRKRLSAMEAAEEEDDLSWDIEDDDEPVKA